LQEAAETAVEPVRRLLWRDRSLVAMARGFRGANALEPGGPSELFEKGNELPLYPQLSRLDILDFAEHTLWSEGQPPPALRRGAALQHRIGEAARLDGIADASYDALLACHVLEHLANPVAALLEWRRAVRPGGQLVIVVPHLEATFDHRRPVTTLAHLLQDAARETAEDDPTHLAEVLDLHDLDRDPGAESRETFERRARENAQTRAVHHHTFTSRSIAALLAAVEVPLVALKPRPPYHIICVCRLGAAALTDLQLEQALAASPFSIDRQA
jgi:SAM-dependent methyltransferase